MADRSLQQPDSARILKFTGSSEGRFARPASEAKAHINALNDARHIIAAKHQSDDWTAMLLVSILAVMDKDQRVTLELSLATKADESDAAQQALALVRLANSGSEYRKRVSAALDVLDGDGRC